jgi:hypothetical protein
VVTATGKPEIQPNLNDTISRNALSSDHCAVLDCFTQIFVWIGGKSLLKERKLAIEFARVIIVPIK